MYIPNMHLPSIHEPQDMGEKPHMKMCESSSRPPLDHIFVT